jgi:cytoskeletal protein RodZ
LPGRYVFPEMNKPIGQQLQQARQDRSLSLERVANDTLIRQHYLHAMEAGEFNAMPSIAQARGFLRAYATYLDLDPEPLLASLEGQTSSKVAASSIQQAASAPEGTFRPKSNGQAEEIFTQLGQSLKKQRELLGLSLDDVERHTHLRQRYLSALETGTLENLPSPVQGRGMLNNYASFLGMDPEPLLLRFADGLQIQLAEKQAARPQERPTRPPRQTALPAPLRRLFSSDFLIGSVLIGLLLAFMAWGAVRILASQEDLPLSPTAPSIADVLLVTPSPSQTSTLAPVTPTRPAAAFIPPADEAAESSGTPAIEIPDAGQGGVQIYITVLQRAWMRVMVDGKIEFEGRVIPGSAYNYAGEERIEVLTGNGAALQIFYNQQDLGVLGFLGEVIDRVFTLDGIQTPTATITPTTTQTLRPSPTSRQTATPQGTQPAIP